MQLGSAQLGVKDSQLGWVSTTGAFGIFGAVLSGYEPQQTDIIYMPTGATSTVPIAVIDTSTRPLGALDAASRPIGILSEVLKNGASATDLPKWPTIDTSNGPVGLTSLIPAAVVDAGNRPVGIIDTKNRTVGVING